MLFTRKRFRMYVYFVKWLSCRGRHVGIKGEEFFALHVEGELYGKKSEKPGFYERSFCLFFFIIIGFSFVFVKVILTRDNFQGSF